MARGDRDSQVPVRKNLNLIEGIVVLSAVLLMAGCTLLPPNPRGEWLTKVPTSWYSPHSGAPVYNGWLQDFHDSRLTALVNEAQVNNPNLQATAAQLESAIATARQASSAVYPTLDLNHSVLRTIEGATKKGLGGPPAGFAAQKEFWTFGASLDVSWELDVWGRIRQNTRGFESQASSAAATLYFTRLSLAGQVAKAWFFAVQSKQQLELAQEFVTNFAETYRIVEARFNAGTVTQQDVATAAADVATAKQNAEAAEVTYKEALRSIEVLLGRYPSAQLKVANELRPLNNRVPAGLPSELLERRPDIIAADRQVAAAYHFLESARAARLPQISLTTSSGGTSHVLQNLFNPANVATTFGANLLQPLFDAGNLQAGVAIARANQKEALANYSATAIAAFQEVENALNQDFSLASQEANLASAASNYTLARQIAETRYKEGAIDLTQVLVVQRQELQARTELLSVRGARLEQRVNLYLALGGDFEYIPNRK